MSLIEEAVEKLTRKFSDQIAEHVEGVSKFVIPDEGTILIDAQGVRATDNPDTPADVTLTASAKTFEGIVRGNINPAGSFMTGKLKVHGDMALALRLAAKMAGRGA